MLIFRSRRLKEHPTAVTAVTLLEDQNEGEKEEKCEKLMYQSTVTSPSRWATPDTSTALLLATRAWSRMATIDGMRIFWRVQNVMNVNSFQRFAETLKGNQASCILELVHVADRAEGVEGADERDDA